MQCGKPAERYPVIVNRARIDDATAQFLQASAADLQRQLGIAGGVEVVWLDEAPDGIVLRARRLG